MPMVPSTGQHQPIQATSHQRRAFHHHHRALSCLQSVDPTPTPMPLSARSTNGANHPNPSHSPTPKDAIQPATGPGADCHLDSRGGKPAQKLIIRREGHHVNQANSCGAGVHLHTHKQASPPNRNAQGPLHKESR